MKNSSTKKISVRAGTADAAVFKALIEKNAGTRKILAEPGLSAYRMEDGTTVELFGTGFCCPEYLFAKGNVVVSFQVDHLEETVGQLRQLGATLLGKIETVCPSYRYCHLLTKENTVIGLYENT